MMLARFGANGSLAIFTTSIDGSVLGILTCFGFFVISIVQVIGILCGDKSSRVQVLN